MKRSSQSRFINSSVSRARAIELVSKKRHEWVHDTAPSALRGEVDNDARALAVQQLKKQVQLISDVPRVVLISRVRFNAE